MRRDYRHLAVLLCLSGVAIGGSFLFVLLGHLGHAVYL
jgi:hypothetical protein